MTTPFFYIWKKSQCCHGLARWDAVNFRCYEIRTDSEQKPESIRRSVSTSTCWDGNSDYASARAVREHMVVPALRRREIAQARRSWIGVFAHAARAARHGLHSGGWYWGRLAFR